jgi:hypothetical protein
VRVTAARSARAACPALMSGYTAPGTGRLSQPLAVVMALPGPTETTVAKPEVGSPWTAGSADTEVTAPATAVCTACGGDPAAAALSTGAAADSAACGDGGPVPAERPGTGPYGSRSCGHVHAVSCARPAAGAPRSASACFMIGPPHGGGGGPA